MDELFRASLESNRYSIGNYALEPQAECNSIVFFLTVSLAQRDRLGGVRLAGRRPLLASASSADRRACSKVLPGMGMVCRRFVYVRFVWPWALPVERALDLPRQWPPCPAHIPAPFRGRASFTVSSAQRAMSSPTTNAARALWRRMTLALRADCAIFRGED